MPTREQILAAAEAPTLEAFEVPEWGDDPVYIRALSAKDALTLTDGVPEIEVPFRLLVGCICDAEGSPIFEPGDEETLKLFPLGVIMRVFERAAAVNGLSASELEGAVSRFEPAQGNGSSTA
jgi:hypothetical protein